MKMRLLVIGSLLVILLALMTAPVSAAPTGTTAVTGNPSSYVAISLNQSSIYMPLDPTTSPVSNATLGITVTSNKAFSVVVSDTTGRGVGDQGFMGNYTGGYVGSPSNTKLGSAIQLAGTTSGTTSAVTVTPPIDVGGKPLYSGTAAVNSQLLTPNTFSQVVTVTDVVLPGSNTYRIDLTFTISAV